MTGNDADRPHARYLEKRDPSGADARRNPVSTEPESVLSGRTLDEVAEEEDPEPPEGEG